MYERIKVFEANASSFYALYTINLYIINMCSDYLILRIFIPFAKIESTNVQATVFNRIYETRMAKISKDTRNESLLPLLIQSYEKTIAEKSTNSNLRFLSFKIFTQKIPSFVSTIIEKTMRIALKNDRKETRIFDSFRSKFFTEKIRSLVEKRTRREADWPPSVI